MKGYFKDRQMLMSGTEEDQWDIREREKVNVHCSGGEKNQIQIN